MQISRCIGMNVRPIDLKSRTAMLILAVNVILNCVLCVSMLSSLFQLSDLKSTHAIDKPLFRKLIYFYTPVTSPICTIWNTILYIFYGPNIFRLLDCYHKVYSKTKLKRIALAAFVSIHTILMISYINHGWNDLNSSNPLETIVLLYDYIIFSLQDYLVWVIVAYYKYGTYLLLVDIHQNLTNTSTQINENRILKQIQTLALHNHKLNLMVSQLIIVFFVISGIFLVISVAGYVLDTSETYNLDYVLFMGVLFICYIVAVHFSVKIDHALNTINTVLQCKYNQSMTNKQNNPSSALKQHKSLCSLQISLYRKYFHLNLFDCIAIDYTFCLHFALFIFSNILIIIQTN